MLMHTLKELKTAYTNRFPNNKPILNTTSKFNLNKKWWLICFHLPCGESTVSCAEYIHAADAFSFLLELIHTTSDTHKGVGGGGLPGQGRRSTRGRGGAGREGAFKKSVVVDGRWGKGGGWSVVCRWYLN